MKNNDTPKYGRINRSIAPRIRNAAPKGMSDVARQQPAGAGAEVSDVKRSSQRR